MFITRSPDCCCPPADLSEDKDGYDLCAEVPGLSMTDLKVEWQGTTLCFEGTTPPPVRRGDGLSDWSERCHGSVGRCFTFPDDVDLGRSSAQVKDGVLCVHVPKAEATKPRKVEVKAG